MDYVNFDCLVSWAIDNIPPGEQRGSFISAVNELMNEIAVAEEYKLKANDFSQTATVIFKHLNPTSLAEREMIEWLMNMPITITKEFPPKHDPQVIIGWSITTFIFINETTNKREIAVFPARALYDNAGITPGDKLVDRLAPHVGSKSEARRLIEQGGVTIMHGQAMKGEVIKDVNYMIGGPTQIRVGKKRFIEV